MSAAYKATLFELAFIGSFLAWRITGQAGAENLFLFLAWGASSLIIFTFVLAAAIGHTVPPRAEISKWRGRYNLVRTLTLIMCLAWLGMYWLAATWALAWVLAVSAASAKPDALH